PHNARAADWDANPFSYGTPPNCLPQYPLTCMQPEKLRRDDSFYQASLRLDVSVSDTVTLSSISSYNKYKQNFVLDTDGANINNFTQKNYGNISSYNQEVRLAGTTDRVKWIVGASYYKERSEDNINSLDA